MLALATEHDLLSDISFTLVDKIFTVEHGREFAIGCGECLGSILDVKVAKVSTSRRLDEGSLAGAWVGRIMFGLAAT